MEKVWYASCTPGVERIIAEIVSAKGATRIEKFDGALTYSCSKTFDLDCFNNLFRIVTFLPAENLNGCIKLILDMKKIRWPEIIGETYRIVIMEKGKLQPVDAAVMRLLERRITAETGLVPDRGNPDVEIWINSRSSSKGFLMVRVKKHRPFEKVLAKGELRPDLIDIMLHLASIGKEDVMLDPFGGSGAISKMASNRGHKLILTGDLDPERVANMKRTLAGHGKVKVSAWNGLHMPLKDGSINAIVTDPPWGEFKAIDNPNFYDEMVAECMRLLAPFGRLIFLTSKKQEATSALNKQRVEYDAYDLTINGKKCTLFYHRKGGDEQQVEGKIEEQQIEEQQIDELQVEEGQILEE